MTHIKRNAKYSYADCLVAVVVAKLRAEILKTFYNNLTIIFTLGGLLNCKG